MSETNEHAGRLEALAEYLDDKGEVFASHDCKNAAAEIERLAALERRWLPIADAPRDGTRLELLNGLRACYGHFSIGHWWDERNHEIHPTHYRREPEGPIVASPAPPSR